MIHRYFLSTAQALKFSLTTARKFYRREFIPSALPKKLFSCLKTNSSKLIRWNITSSISDCRTRTSKIRPKICIRNSRSLSKIFSASTKVGAFLLPTSRIPYLGFGHSRFHIYGIELLQLKIAFKIVFEPSKAVSKSFLAFKAVSKAFREFKIVFDAQNQFHSSEIVSDKKFSC